MEPYSSIIRQENFIAGRWKSGPGEKLAVKDKYTGTLMAEVPQATEKDVDEAVEAASRAFGVLRAWSCGQRAEHIGRMRDALCEKKEEFLRLIVAEAGKPISYARAEVNRAVALLEHAQAEAVRLAGEVVPMDFSNGQGKTAFTRLFPVGPVLCVTPFNFPLNLALHKAAPAMAVGCPVILKPSPHAPLTALALTALFEQAGFPEGAISTFVCDNRVAEKALLHDKVKMLSFTGSAGVGWRLKNLCGSKKVALELGGNAAAIVDASADVASAARSLAVGCFLYAGQVCISTQRIYVLEPVYDAFLDELLKQAQNTGSGDPRNEKVINGPVIGAAGFERISSWVQDARGQGAVVLAGGEPYCAARNIYAPTLLTRVSPAMDVVAKEIFGPVAVVEKVKDFSEACARVNDSRYGLQAAVFSDSHRNVKTAFERLEVGGVIVNDIPGFRTDTMPYGGVKDSGLGREGVRYAMREMTEPRLLVF